MTAANRTDMLVIRMGIDTLLECIRQTEAWWKERGDGAALMRTQQLCNTILATRRKFFPDVSDIDTQIVQARIVAEGLRECARQCMEGQAALQTRLTAAADAIEQLCRMWEAQL